MSTFLANEIMSRAGDFLDRRNPGPSKDKRVAQILGISPDMAGLLRRGRGWTAERIAQVWKLYGSEFPAHVFGMPIAQSDMLAELAHLRAEITAQREEIADVAHRLAALSVASVAGQAGDRAGNEGEQSGEVARRSRGVLLASRGIAPPSPSSRCEQTGGRFQQAPGTTTQNPITRPLASDRRRPS